MVRDIDILETKMRLSNIVWHSSQQSDSEVPAAAYYPANSAARSNLDLMVAQTATAAAAARMPAETTGSLPEETAFVVKASELTGKAIVDEAEVLVAGQDQQEAGLGLKLQAWHGVVS